MRDSEISAEIQKIKDRFLEILPDRLREISIFVEKILITGKGSKEEYLTGLTQALHKMAGTAGSLEFHQISQLSKKFLYFCRSIKMDDAGMLKAEEIEQIKQYLKQLEESINELISQ